jgi:hypothetical protein
MSMNEALLTELNIVEELHRIRDMLYDMEIGLGWELVETNEPLFKKCLNKINDVTLELLKLEETVDRIVGSVRAEPK